MDKNVVIPPTRYVPLTQQIYCCVPACLQMIMLKHQIPLVAAEILGHHLGLVVSPHAQDLFYNVATSEHPPAAGYGTRLHLEAYDPNVALASLGIALHITFHSIHTEAQEQSLRTCFEQAEHHDRDVLLCFDAGTLSGHACHYGHVCVFDRLLAGSPTRVQMIDPEPHQPKWRSVLLHDLVRAMMAHRTVNLGGFWEVERINEHSRNMDAR